MEILRETDRFHLQKRDEVLRRREATRSCRKRTGELDPTSILLLLTGATPDVFKTKPTQGMMLSAFFHCHTEAMGLPR